MNPFVVYQIKVAIFLVAFYLLYRVLMRRETFYRLNRILLIGILVASFVLPQCVVTIHSSVSNEPVQEQLPAVSGELMPTCFRLYNGSIRSSICYVAPCRTFTSIRPTMSCLSTVSTQSRINI